VNGYHLEPKRKKKRRKRKLRDPRVHVIYKYRASPKRVAEDLRSRCAQGAEEYNRDPSRCGRRNEGCWAVSDHVVKSASAREPEGTYRFGVYKDSGSGRGDSQTDMIGVTPDLTVTRESWAAHEPHYIEPPFFNECLKP